MVAMIAMATPLRCNISAVSAISRPTTQTTPFITNCLVAIALTKPVIAILVSTSGYAMWFMAGGAIRITHYDVIDDVITQKL